MSGPTACFALAALLLVVFRPDLTALWADCRRRVRRGRPDDALPRRVVLTVPQSLFDQRCAPREAARTSPALRSAGERRAAA